MSLKSIEPLSALSTYQQSDLSDIGLLAIVCVETWLHIDMVMCNHFSTLTLANCISDMLSLLVLVSQFGGVRLCVEVQSVRGSVCQCVGLLVSQFGGASVCGRSEGQSVGLGGSVGMLVVGQRVGWSACQLVSLGDHRFVEVLVCGLLEGWPISWLVWECQCVSMWPVGESACCHSLSMLACWPVSLGVCQRWSVKVLVCGQSEGQSICGLCWRVSMWSIGESVCCPSEGQYAAHLRVGMLSI